MVNLDLCISHGDSACKSSGSRVNMSHFRFFFVIFIAFCFESMSKYAFNNCN